MASAISCALRRGLALHRSALVPARGTSPAPAAAAAAAAAATTRRWQSSSGGTTAVSGGETPTGGAAEPSPADAAPGPAGGDTADAAGASAAGVVTDAEAGAGDGGGGGAAAAAAADATHPHDAANAADVDAPTSPTTATADGGDGVRSAAADAATGGNEAPGAAVVDDAEATAEAADGAAPAPTRRDRGGGGNGRGRTPNPLRLIPSRKSQRVSSAAGRSPRDHPMPAGVRDPTERRFLLLRGASGVASRADVALFLTSAGVRSATVPRGEAKAAVVAAEPGPSPRASATGRTDDTPDADAGADADAAPADAGAAAADASAAAANADADASPTAAAAAAPSMAVGLAAALSPPSDAAVVAASRIARLSFSLLHNRSDWLVELPSAAAAEDAVARTQGRVLGLMLARSAAVNAYVVAAEGGASFLAQAPYPGEEAPVGRGGADGAGTGPADAAAASAAGPREATAGGGGAGGRRRRGGGAAAGRSVGTGGGIFPKFEDRARAVVVRSRVPLGGTDIFSLFSGYEVARVVGDPNVSKAVRWRGGSLGGGWGGWRPRALTAGVGECAGGGWSDWWRAVGGRGGGGGGRGAGAAACGCAPLARCRTCGKGAGEGWAGGPAAAAGQPTVPGAGGWPLAVVCRRRRLARSDDVPRGQRLTDHRTRPAAVRLPFPPARCFFWWIFPLMDICVRPPPAQPPSPLPPVLPFPLPFLPVSSPPLLQVLVLMRTAEEAERVAMDKCHGGASVGGMNVNVRLFQ